jgi:hypothetical protein
MPYDWKKYPVIHLNFSNCEITTAAELTAYLNNQLENIANSFDLKLRGELLTNRFENLIIDVHQIGEVVILLDEYDKPIFDNIYNSNINDIFKVLKGFYSNIKKTEELLHFAFITGVTFYVSLFSNLNNLTDITMNSQYATMLGYTQNELDENLGEMYAKFAKQKSLEVGTLKNEVKNWYNGYRFHENAQTVYNPVSIAKFCENNGEFNNYWFDTGIPTVLINIIRQKDSYFNQILKRPISSVAFKAFEIDKIDPIVLAFQTGYLTIKNTEQYLGKTRYYLDFPNIEVADAFNVFMLSECSALGEIGTTQFIDKITESLLKVNISALRQSLEVFFAGIPFNVHQKNHATFQAIFYTIFRLLGRYIQVEETTSDGRIDAVLQTNNTIYIFEFKLDNNLTALAKIKEKEYYKKYLLDKRDIYIIGVNFNSVKGNIENWDDEKIII